MLKSLVSVLTTILLFNVQIGFADTIVLNNPTDSPLTTKAHDGLLDIIASKAFQQLGYQLKLVKLPAERGLRNANEGIDDGDLSRIAGLEKLYPNLVRVPEKLYDMKFSAFSRKVKIENINWQKLSPFSIGLIRGWKILEQGVSNHGNVLAVRNAELLFQLLKKDHVDIVLYSQWMGMELAKQQSIDDIILIQPPLEEREMFIYLHKKHSKIIPQLVEAIRNLKDSGEYQRIYNKTILSTQ